MKSDPTDRMTVTIALLHSWVSIREPMPAFGDLDSSQDSLKDELDSKAANKGSATKSRNYIHVSIPKSNIEDNQ